MRTEEALIFPSGIVETEEKNVKGLKKQGRVYSQAEKENLKTALGKVKSRTKAKCVVFGKEFKVHRSLAEGKGELVEGDQRYRSCVLISSPQLRSPAGRRGCERSFTCPDTRNSF